MTLHERSGVRDLLYSGWHRPTSIRRFVGQRIAACLKVIDIDWLEACQHCNAPLALIETQAGNRPPKSANITVELGKVAQLPVFSVSYIPNEARDDIRGFRVTQLWPPGVVDGSLSPQEYADWLWSLRGKHTCASAKNTAA